MTTTQEKLTQAEEAWHKLMTGTQEVSVSIAGYGSITYSQTDITKLERYIDRLKGEQAKEEGRPSRRAMLVRF